MPLKVKLGGTIRDIAPFAKRSGLYAALSASVKAGGVYALVSGDAPETAPVITGTPTIMGLAEVGETVTFVPASVTGNPTPTRTWQPISDGVDFGAAQSGDTYVVPTGIGGTDFGVRQIETNALDFDSAVSAVVGVPVVSGDGFSLDFSIPENSQYLALI